jgi:hypothetical protein
MMIPIEAGEGAFRAAFAKHAIFLRRQPRPPFGVGQVFPLHGLDVASLGPAFKRPPGKVVWRDFAEG